MALQMPQSKYAKAAPGDVVVALNRVQVINDEHLHKNLKQLGGFMCTITAASEGFIGYQINMESGKCSFGGKFGAAELNMTETLSHVWLEQYTFWESVEAHEEFHAQFEDVVVDACKKCQAVILSGPEEYYFKVKSSDIPNLTSSTQLMDAFPKEMGGDGDALITKALGNYEQGRTILMAPHYVRPGKENEFIENETQVMEMIKDTPGFVGYMILEQFGMSPTGSAAYTTQSIFDNLKRPGANKLVPRYTVAESKPSKPTYMVHMEWQSPAHARAGLARVLSNPRIAYIHNFGVFDNCIDVPYLSFNTPLMEEYDWRDRIK